MTISHHHCLSEQELADFHRDGYIIRRGLFDAEEMELLRTAAKTDQSLRTHAYAVKDQQGFATRLSLWNEAGDDLFGVVARCRRIVDAMEMLLGGEVYHYHSKMSAKEPFTGGAWEWHQDYGYWYQNGCLYPYMASAFIAVDPNTRENGCMQVLKVSHLMGRIEHGVAAGQTGADMERVRAAMQIMEHVYVEMKPGDVLFFHSNTLHCSDQNRSPNPRWSLICCYNAARNDPYKDSHQPRYHKLYRVDDAQIKRTGVKFLTEAAAFLDPVDDKTVRAEAKPLDEARSQA